MATEIMSFFEKNPLTTPVGQRIASATDASLASENWALNMEICDLINDTEDGPKDGIRAIKKRLQQNAGKNYTVVMYTLTVLETCVKNCGKRFHVLACSKDFVSELVKLIGPKNDPPTVVQEKVLSLIQSWADAFRHQSEMSGVVSIYNELRQKGIEFPMTDLDTMAPIITPQRSVTDSVTVPRPATASPPRTSSPQAMAAVEIGAAIPQSLSPEQLGKLQSEMDIVKTNMTVLSAMLSEVVPGKEHPSDLTLLQELHATCRAMQRRLVDLVGKVAHDQMTAELLHINDEMNNLFLRYSRYEKNREVTKSGGQPAGAEAAASLIDLSEDAGAAAAATSLAGLSLGGGASSQLSQIPSVQAQQGAESAADSEFDMLAQARNVNVSYDPSKRSGSTYQDNLRPDQTSTTLGEIAQGRSQLHRDNDFDEIEAWLGEKEAPPGTEAVESLTSSEFERFLAERAAAAENLPPVAASTNLRSTNTQSRTTRELDKDDKENSLFAL
ncbi:TOM1-like protein 2 isoform X2 [Neocloeon triangulifer]|uniref:TOM1-like protein 2 isoform X2 n=1 Tax=Neocloeon triangulifer TaxID=2078957 RepID=UPI00286EE3A4|nr:TOM1-like protein 2 isoform X2 [Neocloeon triangulifer]